ncbi:methyltransferase [Marinicaulis aureus]|uniref:Methyltransferase n=1 Tax=Hyphococcus aureus TaxID=2666033 RepID=A0ABW1KTD0_9PROT
MAKTLGALLDDFGEFHTWLVQSQNALWVLHAVSRARVLDHLGDEPMAMEALADKAGLKTDMLRRVMTFLASQEVVKIDGEDRVSHTARSRAFQARQEAVRWLNVNFPAGLKLDEALRTGVAAFEHHYGQPLFDYLSERPVIADEFGRLMSSITSGIEAFIFSNHAFKPFTRAVDIGGSHGQLMSRLLTEYPSAMGVIFDLPGTAAQAEKNLAASPLKERIEIIGGDFFKAVPAGGDLYLMKQILHDWGDEECVTILKNIRAAIAQGGRLAIIDFILPETPTPHPGYALDINMLCLLAGGRERRLSEFEEIFSKAGFALDRVTENPNGQSLLEAVAV